MATPSHEEISLIRSRYEALNGVRGLAILMVFVNHYGRLFLPVRVTETLWPGVDLFFVLSGFLITGILYDSKQRQSYFRDFYIRRSLRIFPLYYGFFLLLALLTPILHVTYSGWFWSNLLYVSNFARLHPQVHNPTVFFIGRSEFGLGPLWSLCVEEQFYLVWPLVMWCMPSRIAAMRFCAVATVCTVLVRTLVYFHDPAEVAHTHFLYFVTYARCDALFLGSWLALWLRGVRLSLVKVRVIAYSLLIAGVAILVGGARLVGHRWPENEVNPLLCMYGYTVIDLVALGLLLLALDTRTQFHRWMKNKQLASLGVVSYGFYFLHYLPFNRIVLLQAHHPSARSHGFLIAVAVFVVLYGLAVLSFRYLESPFLKLKDRWAPSHRSVPSGFELEEVTQAV